jgi:hypothetical protein
MTMSIQEIFGRLEIDQLLNRYWRFLERAANGC